MLSPLSVRYYEINYREQYLKLTNTTKQVLLHSQGYLPWSLPPGRAPYPPKTGTSDFKRLGKLP